MYTTHKKDTKILFYEIKNETSDLLSKLLYKYSIQESILKEKHKLVLDYLHSKDKILEVDLNQIHKIINKGLTNNPYNIYITNEDLVIKNTTYKPDFNFNLSFAQKSFEEHYLNQVIGVSSPIFEKSSKRFLSFTDSYIVKDNDKKGIVQVSYNYPDTKQQLLNIQALIKKYSNIKDAKAYILVNDGFVNDLILKDFKAYKPTLLEINQHIKDGEKIKKKLDKTKLTVHQFSKNNINYHAMFLSTQSPIFENTKIIYSILLDDTEFRNKIYMLNTIMIIITIMGIISILIIIKIRNKETRLNEQDKFVQSSMHEIRTPLSVITLNNELRQLEFGDDEYSTEIDNATRVLQNSYNDMSFIITQENLNYKKEDLVLADILHDRINYFESIVKANDRTFTSNISSNKIVNISLIELTRLIDNNLSNAIKYSMKDSKIEITLQDNILQFHTYGTEIKNPKKIFKKYYRENNVIGGYGLGLSIVNDITKKYNIDITLQSDTKIGTLFTYTFN